MNTWFITGPIAASSILSSSEIKMFQMNSCSHTLFKHLTQRLVTWLTLMCIKKLDAIFDDFCLCENYWKIAQCTRLLLHNAEEFDGKICKMGDWKFVVVGWNYDQSYNRKLLEYPFKFKFELEVTTVPMFNQDEKWDSFQLRFLYNKFLRCLIVTLSLLLSTTTLSPASLKSVLDGFHTKFIHLAQACYDYWVIILTKEHHVHKFTFVNAPGVNTRFRNEFLLGKAKSFLITMETHQRRNC